jgi:hypothetical protein
VAACHVLLAAPNAKETVVSELDRDLNLNLDQDVSAHIFTGFDDLDDDEPIAQAAADEDDDSPDVTPHGMSNFG